MNKRTLNFFYKESFIMSVILKIEETDRGVISLVTPIRFLFYDTKEVFGVYVESHCTEVILV